MYQAITRVVIDMANTAGGIFRHQAALRGISDEQLDEIIRNTQANQASLNRFYSTLINERVRRGLNLPDDRQGLED